MKLLAFLLLCFYIIGVSSQRKKTTTTTRKPRGCMRYCLDYYYHACGHNGKCTYEFKNSCFLYNKNCQNKKIQRPEFKLIHKGQCHHTFGKRCSADQI